MPAESRLIRRKQFEIKPSRLAVIGLLLMIVGGLISGGCVRELSLPVYRDPNFNFEKLERIAVLPFENLSVSSDAGKKITDLFITELLKREKFKIKDTGEVERILREERIRSIRKIDTATMKKIGQGLEVEAIVLGSVHSYQITNSIPEVGLSVRMIDSKSGSIIWMVTQSRSGKEFETIFGMGKITSISRLAQTVVREMLDSLK